MKANLYKLLNNLTISQNLSRSINHVVNGFKVGRTYTVSSNVNTSDKNLILIGDLG